jgi:hypothetical protein
MTIPTIMAGAYAKMFAIPFIISVTINCSTKPIVIPPLFIQIKKPPSIS